MKKSFWSFLCDQYATVPPVLTRDLKGKTVVVIGANTGIGFETAVHFAKMGAERLILGCRSRSRGEDALKALNYPKAELRLIDLSSFASVKSFAETFENDEFGIDILMLNAAVGVSPDPYYTDDGWEQSLQVNDLALSYLALLLLPALKRAYTRTSSPSRLVITSSEVHYWTNWDDVVDEKNILGKLNDKEYTSGFNDMGRKRYFDSKLINVFFTRQFASLLASSSSGEPWLLATTVNPGLCRSELGRNVTSRGVIFRVVSSIYLGLLGRTSEQGARQLVWAALATEKEAKAVAHKNGEVKIQGAYVSSTSVEEPSDFVLSEKGKDVQQRIWNETLDVLAKVDSQVKDRVTEYLSV